MFSGYVSLDVAFGVSLAAAVHGGKGCFGSYRWLREVPKAPISATLEFNSG